MKILVIAIITVYQALISPFLTLFFGPKICRYTPSCSEYAKQMFAKHGIISGLKYTAARLMSCQPWGKSYGTNI